MTPYQQREITRLVLEIVNGDQLVAGALIRILHTINRLKRFEVRLEAIHVAINQAQSLKPFLKRDYSHIPIE